MKKILQSVRDYEHQDTADKFIRFLDRSEGKTRSTKKFKQKKSFAPSGVGYGKGRCPRYWYYAFNGAEFDERFDGLSVRNMDNGTNVHERFQQALEDAGVAIEIEPKAILEDPPIFGYIDGIVEWDDKKWVIEFKTTRTEYFDKRRQQLKPPVYHMVQLLLYMHITGIDQGMLIYQDNNNHRRTAIAVQKNKHYSDYIDVMLDWMRKVYETVTGEDSQIPERGFSKSSNQCKFCPVRDVCWSDDREGDVKLKNLPNVKV